MAKKALILGGAGFIGSNVAARFVEGGYQVTIIDGLLPKTGGRRVNLGDISSRVRFFHKKIQDVANLRMLILESDVVIDCMAWTSHNLAMFDPLYDIKLNVESHLYLIKNLKNTKGKKVIYLGSRSQYGRLAKRKIIEDDPMVPVDVQGVSKLAAEYFFKIYSGRYGLNVVSLRFGNCFGANQNVEGGDVGLIGLFVKEAIAGAKVQIFGEERKRSVVFVDDLAEVVFRISQKEFSGFEAYNLAGKEIRIHELAERIIKIVGFGSIVFAKMPKAVQAIDIGEGILNQQKIRRFLGKIPETRLDDSLRITVEYFRDRLTT